MKSMKTYLLVIAIFFAAAVSAGTALAWAPGDPLVQCGRGSSAACGICDLVVGFVGIANYGLRLAVFLALVAIVAGGVMYVVSGGSSGMTGTAKETIQKALIGMSIVLLSWVIVNSLLRAISKDESSWIQSTGWESYTCN